MWGWLKGLGKVVGGVTGLTGAVGAGMGAGSQAAANNRGQKFTGQLDMARMLQERALAQQQADQSADNDYFDQTIGREVEGRAGRQDAWRKLLSAGNVLSPAAMPNVSPYAAPQRQATDMERQGAGALSSEVLARLQGGNPMPAVERRNADLGQYAADPRSVVDMRLLNPGRGENVSGWLAALLQGIGGGPGADGAPMDERPRPTGYTSPRVTQGMRF